jgi:hypothetical protein
VPDNRAAEKHTCPEGTMPGDPGQLSLDDTEDLHIQLHLLGGDGQGDCHGGLMRVEFHCVQPAGGLHESGYQYILVAQAFHDRPLEDATYGFP